MRPTTMCSSTEKKIMALPKHRERNDFGLGVKVDPPPLVPPKGARLAYVRAEEIYRDIRREKAVDNVEIVLFQFEDAQRLKPDRSFRTNDNESSSGEGLAHSRHILRRFGWGLALIAVGFIAALLSLFMHGPALVYSALALWFLGGWMINGAFKAADAEEAQGPFSRRSARMGIATP
jgi:hypothetical protein